jgi:hypothetical protein
LQTNPNPPDYPNPPDFRVLLEATSYNVREALNELEMEIAAPSGRYVTRPDIPDTAHLSSMPGPVLVDPQPRAYLGQPKASTSSSGSEAALKAWETRRRLHPEKFPTPHKTLPQTMIRSVSGRQD